MNLVQLRAKLTKRRLTRILGVLGIVYISVGVYFWGTQRTKILAPLAKIDTTPARKGFPSEGLTIPILDNTQNPIGQLKAFWVTVDNPDAPVLLYLHGQDATRGKNLEHTERFYRWGFNVLVIDYRGYAESYGEEHPSEASVYDDALTALNYLTNDLKISPSKIFIYGHSLGGAVAIELATRPESSHVAGIIVESTFTSVLDMSALRYGGMLKLWPVRFLLTEKFDSLSKIDRVRRPILFIHGDCDAKVPFRMTKQLHTAARPPKHILIVNGAGHENCGSIGTVEYHQKLIEFMSLCLEPISPER